MQDREGQENTQTAPLPAASATATASAAAAAPTIFLREISLGKKENRGVRGCRERQTERERDWGGEFCLEKSGFKNKIERMARRLICGKPEASFQRARQSRIPRAKSSYNSKARSHAALTGDASILKRRARENERPSERQTGMHQARAPSAPQTTLPPPPQVAALDFSPDGDLLVAMAGGEPQSLSVWDWRRGERLATARAEYLHLCVNSVRFNPWLFLQGPAAEETGLGPPGAACYTLVSCGERHVRFWTLTRERCRTRAGGDGGGGQGGGKAWGGRGWSVERKERKKRSGGGGGGGGGGGCSEGPGWEWCLTSRPGHFGMRGEIESMTCMAFIGEPRAVREERQERMRRAVGKGNIPPLPTARVITGAGNGQVGGRELDVVITSVLEAL